MHLIEANHPDSGPEFRAPTTPSLITTKKFTILLTGSLWEQGVELVVIKELLGHAHIVVTATVYAHVRLRLQRDAIDLLSHALRKPSEAAAEPDDGNDPPLCAALVR